MRHDSQTNTHTHENDEREQLSFFLLFGIIYLLKF